ncbi:TIR domain-containing protein [Streptomyces griseoaurantiacus]|uniref:TIR domain-containing protein n=1 Tax=Streptomyces griseoaurantiacus TaxID=68213 RepID=UPI003814DAB1
MDRRVFVSSTSDLSLDDRRRSVKTAIVDRLRDAGYSPEAFWELGRAENLSWNFDNVDQVMRSCVGALVIGFPRWALSHSGRTTRLVGEYNHYDTAVAFTLGLPVMLIVEQGVEERGVTWPGAGRTTITQLPEDATADWTNSDEFQRRFTAWQREMAGRSDVFLGYCSRSRGIAAQVSLFLHRHGATVHDWAMDFRSGLSILSEIERAQSTCTSGIFLFTEDDPLQGVDGGAAPRDNVVFEAGHFMASKGSQRCLIIREGDAKMPADLGGAIYLNLPKGATVDSIEGRLLRFLDENL